MLKTLFASGRWGHFFSHPGEEFYVRHLASVLGKPVGTVARELAHLEKAGILSSRRVGNQKHYRVAEQCPILDELRTIFLKTCGAAAELRDGLEKIAGVELAFVYGSYASGEAHAGSDLDLMIVGDVSDRELAPAIARIERRLKREINYTTYTREDVEQRLGRKGEFVHEVFAGPRVVLVGDERDRLFRTAR